MNALQKFRIKAGSLIAGSKLPVRYELEGKTYFALDKSNLEKFFQVLNCEYTDYNLVVLLGSIAEIFAPLHAIAWRVANACYEVRKVKDDSVVTNNDALNQLLTQPNPLQNFQEFIYESVIWQYINGANFMYFNIPDTLAVDYKNVGAIWNLWSYQVQVLHEARIKFLSATTIGDIIKGYRLADGSPDIAPEKVLFNQFMSLDRNDNKIKGRSPLLSAQKAIANLIAVYEARGCIYINRGALGLLVSEMKDIAGITALTPEQKKEAIEDYQTNYGVTSGKTPIGITGLPMKWIQIAMSIAELMPFEETKADAAAIYGVLDVPEILMPTPKDSTFENQKIAERALYQNVATPLAKSRAQALTNYLRLREIGLYISASHDHVEVLQDNKKEKAEASKVQNESLFIQYRCGAITMNQWIAAIGGEPVKNNPLYDKRTLEMTAEELAIIIPLINIRGGGSAGSGDQNNGNHG